MPAGAESWVVDTSALLCLKGDEAGAERVERLVQDMGREGRVFVSFISLMEYAYVLQRQEGETGARTGYAGLRQLPLRVVESDEDLGLKAARIKAAHPLSVADAWVAATAERLGAVLVHKDSDFEPLAGRIKLEPLPYRRSTAG